ncbi:hypothetical protein JCM11251_001520 [Rhodosporidiobolus azoricus]
MEQWLLSTLAASDAPPPPSSSSTSRPTLPYQVQAGAPQAPQSYHTTSNYSRTAFDQPPFTPEPSTSSLLAQYPLILPHPSHSGREETQEVEEMDHAANGGETLKLSNARMPKKPKPRPAAPDGVIVTDKSCARCRARKVRCNRIFPRCDHCTQRKETCDLADWKPKPKIKSTDPARVAALEKRLVELEEQLAAKDDKEDRFRESAQPSLDFASFPTSAADLDLPLDSSAFDPLAIFSSYPSSNSFVSAGQNRLALSGTPPPPTSAGDFPAASTSTRHGSPGSSPESAPVISSIGTASLDWRLAEPQMASSLARSLTEAFAESCCFLLPTYEFFRGKMSNFVSGREESLSPAQKVALAAFCAVGARTSPHSALLGIGIQPDDIPEHPNAPFLSAGTRRQSACETFFDQAGRANFEAGTMEFASPENLAALLAVLQLSLFAEVVPKRSRPLLRSALSHYKELQDLTASEEEKVWVRKTFGFAVYSSDCLISAYARRKCLITDDDLRTYFSHADTKIILPRLPGDSLLPIVQKLVTNIPNRETALASAKHLLACWTYACQRAFVQLAAPPMKPIEELAVAVQQVWTAIDSTRSAASYLLSICPPATNGHTHSHSHTHAQLDDPSHHTIHEHDFGAQIIRLDRDLLDLINFMHVLVKGLRSPGLGREVERESLRRVRRGLRTRARYTKAYVAGVDVHMTFHELWQLEHLPNWTELVMQRFGTPGGPETVEEEVTETELGWFIEGLQHACFFHPSAEKRLLELDSRFEEVQAAGGRIDRSPPSFLREPSFPSFGDGGGGEGWNDPLLLFPSPPLDPAASVPPTAKSPTPTPPVPSYNLPFSPLFNDTSTSAASLPPPAPAATAQTPPAFLPAQSSPINWDLGSPLTFEDTGLGALGDLGGGLGGLGAGGGFEAWGLNGVGGGGKGGFGL